MNPTLGRGNLPKDATKAKKKTAAEILREIDTELVYCNMNFPEKQEALRIVRNKLNDVIGGTLGPNAPPIARSRHKRRVRDYLHEICRGGMEK